jgi:hypothetical protein
MIIKLRDNLFCASGAARPMKVEKAKHPRTVPENGSREVQRRIAQERIPTGGSASRHQKSLETAT